MWRHHVTRPNYRVEQSLSAIKRGDWASAEVYAKRLESSGHFDLAHLVRAEVYFARKQFDLAILECNKIRDEGEIRVRAATVSGKSLLELGALAEANRVFLFVLSQDPDSVDGHRGLAAIAFELGQSSRALLHINHVIRLDPTDARPHRLKGEVLDSIGDRENAVVEYREALRLRNGLSDLAIEQVRFDLAEGLVRQSQYSEALATIEEARVADNQTEPPHFVAIRIEALRGLGRNQQAAAIAEQALKVWPEGAFFRLRGQLYLDEGHAKEAVRYLEQAAKLSPNHYQSHFLLAQAYSAADRKEDAQKANARADALSKDSLLNQDLEREAMEKPWDAEVRLKLAKLCERTGDFKSAAIWRKAAAHCQMQRR
jgi:tetratricopeptide (TPR) repeat protein